MQLTLQTWGQKVLMGCILAGALALGFMWWSGSAHAAFIQSATGTKTSNQATPASVSATLATSPVAGQLLIAMVGANGNATITGPAGWSTAINQSGTPSQAIFYKIAAGTELTVTSTVNANPGSIGIQVFVYSGNTTSFAEVSSATGTSAAPNGGSVTTTDANELVFSAFTLNTNVTTANTSWNDGGEGFAERADVQTGGAAARRAGYTSGDNLTNSAGSHGVTTATSASSTWRGQTVRFRTKTSVTDVTSSLENGTYGAGQVVPIQITFSRAVTVNTIGGTPELGLNNGAHPRYSSGSGTNTLTFNYTIGSGGDIVDLDYAAIDALSLARGTILDDVNSAAVLTLPVPSMVGSLGFNKDIAIHTGTPTFSLQYYADSDLTVSLGDHPHLAVGTYYIAVIADEVLEGAPTISIHAAGTENDVTDGATVLVYGNTYRYARTVVYDAAANGEVASEVHITGTDAAGNESINAHPSNMTTVVAYIDTVAPAAPVIESISSNNYVSATEKSNIIVTGTAEADSLVSVTLSDGTNSRTQTQQLSGGSTIFSVGIDGLLATPAALEDGTLTPSVTATDIATNVSLADTAPVAIQDSIAPSLGSVSIASNNVNPAYAKAGDIVTLTFTSSEDLSTPSVTFNGAPVSVSGSGTSWTASRTMTLADAEGAMSVSISYNDLAQNPGAPITNTMDGSSVTFEMTPPILSEISPVATPANDSTPQYTFSSSEAGAITYGGSCMSAASSAFVGPNIITFNELADGVYLDCTVRVTDLAGNISAVLNVSSFTVDTSAAAVLDIHSENTDGVYHESDIITIHVEFDETVYASGAPFIALNASGSAVATYFNGSGTDFLIFHYTVALGDVVADLDYTSTTALSLNGGAITDAAGSPANTVFPAIGAPGSLGQNSTIEIDASIPDTNAPVVTSVSSMNADGLYGVEDTVTVIVQFDEVVEVTGTPQLNLAIGGGRYVDYVSGSGSGSLLFTFTVEVGDDTADLSYVDENALVLNGGSIVDMSANVAVITLPALGSMSSLGGHTDIRIHTSIPALAEVTPIGTYTLNANPTYVFSTDEEGSIVYGGDCSSTTAYAAVGNNSIQFNALTEGAHTNCTITVTDYAGNISATLAISSFEINITEPAMVQVIPAAHGITRESSRSVYILFSEPMDPTTFAIADDNSNLYEAPVWSDDYRSVTIAHAKWTAALIAVSVDAENTFGVSLSAPAAWSFTLEGARSNQLSSTCAFQSLSSPWQQNNSLEFAWIADAPEMNHTDLLYSLDNRATWTTMASVPNPARAFVWNLYGLFPEGTNIYIQMFCGAEDGSVLGGDEELFIVPGEDGALIESPGEDQSSEGQPVEPEVLSPFVFNPEEERRGVLDINEDKSSVEGVRASGCGGANLIKSSTEPTIYFCGRDGLRHPFPDVNTYRGWYRNFLRIRVVDSDVLNGIRLGSNVTHRPGVYLVKFPLSEKVYAVSKGGVLHWVTTEEMATQLYGEKWNSFVVDIDQVLYSNYKIGEPISSDAP